MSDYNDQPMPELDVLVGLEAGKSLDALVARRVLGWHWNLERLVWLDDRDSPHRGTPNFSTQLEMAWTIHERMLNRIDEAGNILHKWQLDRVYALTQMPGVPLGARVWSVNLSVGPYCALITGATPMEVICRAALWVAAIEARVDGS